MIAILIYIVSLLLDGILTNFLPFMVNDLSIFTPLLTVVSIFIVYPFYYKQTKKYYIHVFLLGMIYDLFYTNLLFMNALLFLVIALLSKYIYQNIEIHWFQILLLVPFMIAIYELLIVIVLFCFQLVPVTIEQYSYKVLHSLLLNMIYAEVLYLLLKLVPKKYKKISIN